MNYTIGKNNDFNAEFMRLKGDRSSIVSELLLEKAEMMSESPTKASEHQLANP